MAEYDKEYGKVYRVVERNINNNRTVDKQITEISRYYVDKILQTNWDDGFTIVLPNNEAHSIFPTKRQAENCLDMICQEIATCKSATIN